MGKTVDVVVHALHTHYEFTIESLTTGIELLQLIADTIALRDVKFFGLNFTDKHGFDKWLKLNKKILSQDVSVKKGDPLHFRFRVKFFPEDVEEEFSHDSTALRMLYLQVKDSISLGEINCPQETTELLESYSNKELMFEYLSVAQHLKMYGNNYYEVRDRTGIDLWLSVNALGLNIHEKADKLTPKIMLPWSDIRNLSFNDKKFVIKFLDTKAPNIILICANFRISKLILGISMGNHELYMRRRLTSAM